MQTMKLKYFQIFTILLLFIFFILQPSTLFAQEIPQKTNKIKQKKRNPQQKKSKEKSKEKNQKKKSKKTRQMWDYFVKKMSKLVPQPVKKSWEKTKEKWHQTVIVYRAMKMLMSENNKERKRRLKKEKKEKIHNKWLKQDHQIEKQIRQQMKRGFWQKACISGSASSCLKWLKSNPLKIKAWHSLRDIWMRRKKWHQLLPICRRLSKLPNNELLDHLCYARSLVALKNKKKAYKLYSKYVKQYPKNGFIWLELGLLYLSEGKTKKASQACQKASKLIPKEADVWECLGSAFEKKNSKLALQVYYKACKLDSAKACRMVLKLRPKGLNGLLWWSSIITRISRQKLSKGTIQQSCRLGFTSACQQLGKQYRNKGKQMLTYKQLNKAKWLFQQATQIAPKDYKNWKILGLHFFKQKQWDEASLALKKTLELKQNQPLVWYALGQCYHQLEKQKKQQAKQAYKKACALGQNAACQYIKFQH